MLINTRLNQVNKLVSVLLTVFFLLTPVFAADKNTAGDKFFEEKVRPLLAEHCFSCHGPDK
ncbi:hypothetical protein EB008_07460, partial [bacterium]|nr:hypothetical protein [bacterium]